EDAAVLLHRAAHQLVRRPHLPADVRAECVLQELMVRLAARDRPGIDGAGLLEGLAQLGAGGHGGRGIYTINTSACAPWFSSGAKASCWRSPATATSCSRARRADRGWGTGCSPRATSSRTGAGLASTRMACSSA